MKRLSEIGTVVDMPTTRKMELTFRGKHSFDDCSSKNDLIKRCDEIQDWFEKLPEEMEVFNTDDDYLTFSVEAKDKDDVKYYKRKGFN
jgi:hypothetical protein